MRNPTPLSLLDSKRRWGNAAPPQPGGSQNGGKTFAQEMCAELMHRKPYDQALSIESLANEPNRKSPSLAILVAPVLELTIVQR